MAIPVRALWEATTDEDRARAHQRCIAILEMWLGKRTRRDVAEQLGLPPLRLWQLSQQALSGMLVALVHQPRVRAKRGFALPTSEASELRSLRKENAELRAVLKVTQEMNDVLRQLPGRKSPSICSEPAAPEKTTPARTRRSTSATGQRRAHPAKSAKRPHDPAPAS
jgi:uncharacterized protein (DUF934 family)